MEVVIAGKARELTLTLGTFRKVEERLGLKFRLGSLRDDLMERELPIFETVSAFLTYGCNPAPTQEELDDIPLADFPKIWEGFIERFAEMSPEAATLAGGEAGQGNASDPAEEEVAATTS